jgi:Transposase IS66 family
LFRIDDDDERRLVRQQKSRPLAEAFERWLRAKLTLISQKSKLADALRYALSRWEGLTRFIEDGRIELDNNNGRALDPSDFGSDHTCRPLRGRHPFGLRRGAQFRDGLLPSS